MKKKRMFHGPVCLLIAAGMTFVLLDTFVISRSYASAKVPEVIVAIPREAADSSGAKEADSMQEGIPSMPEKTAEERSEAAGKTEPVITETSYRDENISVRLQEYRLYDTNIYVADVTLSSPEYLFAALAEDTYGKNITSATSEMAADADAVLAINGDYYGARNRGYVLRNGVLYRTQAASSDQEDLVIHADGSFEIINEGSTEAQEIKDAMQVYSFGPALVEEGELSVDEADEVGKARASNPRTAIAEIEPLHYLFVVSDGRSDESEGLSLLELASFLKSSGQ